MAERRKKLVELLSDIQDLATPSNVRYGTAIHRRGGVELIEGGTHRVLAWVGGLDGTSAEGGSTAAHPDQLHQGGTQPALRR